MKHDRLFQILYILLNEGETTAPKLAEQFEVSTRTIYRDIDSLSMSGIPIYTAQGKNGGISLMENFTFDKSLFTDKEQNEILFALESLKATDVEVDNVLTKLGMIFHKNSTNWLEVEFSRWRYKGVDTDRFNILRQGILNKQSIEISYISGSGQETSRKINPLKLIFKQTHWYLQAYCKNAEDFRTFKISRIKELILLDEYFEEIMISSPQIDSYQIKEARLYRSDESYNNGLTSVKLKFVPQIAHRVYDEFPSDDIIKEENGYLTVMTKLPIDFWIYNYILSFGENVQIIQPDSLKNQIQNFLRRMQNHYKS